MFKSFVGSGLVLWLWKFKKNSIKLLWWKFASSSANQSFCFHLFFSLPCFRNIMLTLHEGFHFFATHGLLKVVFLEASQHHGHFLQAYSSFLLFATRCHRI